MATQLGGNRSHRAREIRRQERRARKAIDSAILAALRACPDGLDAPRIAASVIGQPGVHVAQGAVLERGGCSVAGPLGDPVRRSSVPAAGEGNLRRRTAQ